MNFFTSTPFEDALTRTGNGVYNIALAFTCGLALLSMGIDLFGFSLVVAAACDLHLNLIRSGILNSIPYIGIILASFPWGYISDTKGRRFTLMLSLGVSCLLSCLCSLSPHWIVLAVGKFFALCFSCATNSQTYNLMGESCMQKYRNKYVLMMSSLLMATAAISAIITFPIMAMEFNHYIPGLNIYFSPWRLLCIALAIPMGLSAFMLHFFHESPKFLASQGKYDEALKVLKSMYAINHRGQEDNFNVSSISHVENPDIRRGLLRQLFDHSAPLFRKPYLKQTLKLYYIMAIVFLTNNAFVVWLPHTMSMIKAASDAGMTSGTLCEMIANTTRSSEDPSDPPCRGINNNAIYILMISHLIFATISFIFSYLVKHRRVLMMCILMYAAASAILINIIPSPIASAVLYTSIPCTCIAMGIMASYFVDLYPTSYRGMVSCLSIMIGRSSSFIGINVLGYVLFHHCGITFYAAAALIMTAIVACWFLPKDYKPIIEVT